MRFAIVLVAAGASTRMGFPKLWADVCGQPLLARAIGEARAANPSELVVVVSEERVSEAAALAPDARVIAGGLRRRDSVAAGLAGVARSRSYSPGQGWSRHDWRGLVAA